jgi:hypothetical protein
MLRRIFTIVAILASVGVIVVSQVKLREHIQGIIDERKKNGDERDAQRARAVKAERTLTTTSNELASTTDTLNKTKEELETTKGNLAKASGDLDKVKGDLEKAKDAEKAAVQNLAQWTALGMKPEEVKAMKDDLTKSRDTIAGLTVEAQILNRRVASLTNELAKYIDPDNYVVKLPDGLKGNILVVDPKWDFVVLDIGEKQGVLKDGIMLVHRDSKLIGKVKISSVMLDRCIANIMPGWKLADIHEGDQVLF